MPDLEHDSAPELLPCPFCGSTDIYTEGPCYDEFMCNDCGISQNDQNQDRAGAIASWNRRAALRSQSPEPSSSEVRVKPLEWEEFWNRSEAKSAVGDYIIMPRRDGAFDWRLDGVVSCWASSSDAAKAAAQADYEQRIRSALSPTVSQPEVVGVGGEPAAWQRYNERLGWTPVDAEYAKVLAEGGEQVRPLYTAPPDYQALKARLSAVEGALKPFADEAASIPDDVPDLKDLHGYTFQAIDFRRAREALTTITGGENER